MYIKSLLPILLILPFTCLAQGKSGHFGDHMLLGINYGFEEDFVSNRSNQYEVAHFATARAGLSLTKSLYGGIQTRLVRARNFETPAQNFYMAGIWARYYFIHPIQPGSAERFGISLESGFLLGNYAFENRNFVEYAYAQPGSWYIPFVVCAEFRMWRNFTLEGALNLFYNNGGNWDQQGIAYPSLGVNWHL